MQRHSWLFFVWLPFCTTWIVDRLSKIWAKTLIEPLNIGALHIQVFYNPGAILGLFSDLPPILRIVYLSTAGTFILQIFIFLQYLIPSKIKSFKSGLSILVGGIIGNVWDRIVEGKVTDMIFIKIGNWVSPVFNLADILQWIGYFIIIFSIINHHEYLWPKKNSRKIYWVNLDYQIRYCIILLLVGFAASSIMGVFTYTYLRVTLIELTGSNPYILNRFLTPFVYTLGLVILGISLALFVVGKILSRRTAGPIYALEKYLKILSSGQELSQIPEFKLRAEDEFKHLETVVNHLRTSLQDRCYPHRETSENQEAKKS